MNSYTDNNFKPYSRINQIGGHVLIRGPDGKNLTKASPEYVLTQLKKTANPAYPVVSARLRLEANKTVFECSNLKNNKPIYLNENHKKPPVVYFTGAIENYMDNGKHSTHAIAVTAIRNVEGMHRIYFFNPWGNHSFKRVINGKIALDTEFHNRVARHSLTPRNEVVSKRRESKMNMDGRIWATYKDLRRERLEYQFIAHVMENLINVYGFGENNFGRTYMYNGLNLQMRDDDGICMSYATMFLTKIPLNLLTTMNNNQLDEHVGNTLNSYKHGNLSRAFYGLGEISKNFLNKSTVFTITGKKRSRSNPNIKIQKQKNERPGKIFKEGNVKYTVEIIPVGIRVYEGTVLRDQKEQMFPVNGQNIASRMLEKAKVHTVSNGLTYVSSILFGGDRGVVYVVYETGNIKNGIREPRAVSALQQFNGNIEHVEILASLMTKSNSCGRPSSAIHRQSSAYARSALERAHTRHRLKSAPGR